MRSASASAQRLSALQRVKILEDLPESVIERVAASCKWWRREPGEEILAYQSPSNEVYFLVEGEARVIIYSAQGKAVLFTRLPPGQTFGELAAIDGGPRSASVEALAPCTIASLSARDFNRLLLEEPRLAVAVLRHMAADVRRLSDRVFEFSTLAVQNRIHAELLRLASAVAPKCSEAFISPAPRLSEIASRVSTHREAVSRELSRLIQIGVARREKGGLRIKDVPRLAQMVRDAKGE